MLSEVPAIKEILHAVHLVGGGIRLLRTDILDFFATVKQENKAFGARLDTLASVLTELTARTATTKASPIPEPEPEPEPEPATLAPEPTQSGNFADRLLTVAGGAIGVDVEPNEEHRSAVLTVFDLAVAQCHGDTQKAGQLFGSWLQDYNDQLARNPTLERSVHAFAAGVLRSEPQPTSASRM